MSAVALQKGMAIRVADRIQTIAKQMLYEKRIPKEYWDDALADYPDQSEYIVSYLEKADISDSKSARKAIDALIRRGHSYAQIKKAMGRIPMEEDFSED